MTRTGSRIVLVIALAAVAAAVVVSARGPDPDARPTAEAVERRVMSQWCPGLTLDQCPSSQASALRRAIASRVGQGWTNRRIDAWLVAEYGEGVLGRPRRAAAFVAPALVALAGCAAVAWVVRRRPPDVAAAAAAPVPPEEPAGAGGAAGGGGNAGDAYRDRLEEDLRRFSGEVTE